MATLGKIMQLQEFIQIINHFRTIDPELPPQIMVILMEVAANPGSTISSLAERVNLSQPAVSRNVERLGKRWGVDREGEGLVESVENPANRREKLVTLTRKGELFIQSLLALTRKEQTDGDSSTRRDVSGRRNLEQPKV